MYEKLQSLLVTNPSIIEQVGLVIIDELQMISDEKRGPGLELLLTKLTLVKSRLQIIGLSAVLGQSEDLANWMDAKLCESRNRPVELRKGVAINGTFMYREYNSNKEDKEFLPKFQGEQSFLDPIVLTASALAGNGEQTLVFCKSKNECQTTAYAISKNVSLAPASDAIDDLQELEDSKNKQLLTALLRNGIAYHNSDLDYDQRAVIEKHFRSGGIRVLCSTSTLAYGINLPSRNVIIDPECWITKAWGRDKTEIDQPLYENYCGRAGRLGLEDDFGGRLLLPTVSSRQTYTIGNM